MSNEPTTHTILLIDDEIDLQQLVKIALKSRDYIVETANNGLEGLKKLKTLKPQLIILDLNMPKMGGMEFYQNICDSAGQPKYPVLVLTARANMAMLFKEFNIDGFMTKPFEIDELLDEVDTIIGKTLIVKKIKEAGIVRAPKVCIVEDEPGFLKRLGSAFSEFGYSITAVSNGAEAIEYVHGAMPDIVLVKLALKDMAGDIVIFQLKRMAKTRHIKFILYTEEGGEKTIVLDKISKKEGIDYFVQHSSPQQLANAANFLLNL